MGSYLRTNYRITGKQLDIDAIGGAVELGSYLGSVGTRREYGGFIMGSAAFSAACLTIEASDALSAYYGEGMFGAGYRIMPIVAHQVGTGNAFLIHGSCDADGGSNIYFSGMQLTASAAAGELLYTALTGSVVHFVWAGFVISGP